MNIEKYPKKIFLVLLLVFNYQSMAKNITVIWNNDKWQTRKSFRNSKKTRFIELNWTIYPIAFRFMELNEQRVKPFITSRNLSGLHYLWSCDCQWNVFWPFKSNFFPRKIQKSLWFEAWDKSFHKVIFQNYFPDDAVFRTILF